MTASAMRALSYFRSAPSDREAAVSALFAIDWNSDLARVVGSRPLNPTRLLRSEDLGCEEYLIFAYAVAQDSGKSNPNEHPNWLYGGR